MTLTVNKVILVGNLTKEPELRYTSSGTAVCHISLATSRIFTTKQGERREESEYHNVIAWEKLAEISSKNLVKGQKIYIEGRLSTRKYINKEGIEKYITEIIASEMIMVGSSNKPLEYE